MSDRVGSSPKLGAAGWATPTRRRGDAATRRRSRPRPASGLRTPGRFARRAGTAMTGVSLSRHAVTPRSRRTAAIGAQPNQALRANPHSTAQAATLLCHRLGVSSRPTHAAQPGNRDRPASGGSLKPSESANRTRSSSPRQAGGDLAFIGFSGLPRNMKECCSPYSDPGSVTLPSSGSSWSSCLA